jgi:hypothetical protein
VNDYIHTGSEHAGSELRLARLEPAHHRF